MNPSEPRDDAGTDDGLEEIDLHRTEVSLPDGGQIVISDLEEITPERLEEATLMAAEILARRAKDPRS
ncbi:hypothetical protein ACWEGS_28605 [Streptomyces sp. NPDC004822]